MSDEKPEYKLSARFRKARMPSHIYARNDNGYSWIFSTWEKDRLDEMLKPYERWDDINNCLYDVKDGRTLFSVQKITKLEDREKPLIEGIVFIAKSGLEGFLPTYTVNYGKDGGGGEATLNFSEALRLTRCHLRKVFPENPLINARLTAIDLERPSAHL